MDDDNWVETAMEDDTIVANFLLSLNKTSSPSPSLPLYPPFNLEWVVRKPRSKSRRTHPSKTKTESRRASPTTPLSWSAATSASNATANTAATFADGNEESSRFNKPVQSSRSKVDDQSEANANKRSRKKRSLPELLEEEKLLLKERGNLKDKLASMNFTVERERAKNESLKKIKLDLVSQKATKEARTSLVSGKAVVVDPSQLVDATCGSSKLVQPQTVQEKESPVITMNASSSSQQEINNQNRGFLLPDLNLPLEEDFNSDIFS